MKCFITSLCLFLTFSSFVFGQQSLDSTFVRELLSDAEEKLSLLSYSTADSIARHALDLAEGLNFIEGQANAWQLLGWLAKTQGEWSDANYCYQESLSFWTALKDTSQIAILCRDLSTTKNGEGDYIQQMKFAQRGLALFESIKDTLWIGKLSIDLGNAFKNQGKSDLAESAYRKAINFLQKAKDETNLGIAQYGLGSLFYQRDKIDSAKVVLKQAIGVFQETHDSIRLIRVHNLLGALFREEGELEAAISNYKISADLAVMFNDSLPAFDAYLNLARAEIYQGNYQQANDYFAQAQAFLGDSGNSLDNAFIDKIEFALQVLHLERERIELIAIILGLCTLSIGFGTYTYFSIQKQKQKQKIDEFIARQELSRYKQETYALMQDTEKKAEMKERERLRKLIHNTVGSQLAAIKWTLESGEMMLEKGLYKAQDLRNVLSMIETAYGNSRNIEKQLEHKNIDYAIKIGLFFDSLSKVKTDKPKIQFFNHSVETEIPFFIGQKVYEIVQIATANALLYANADNFSCQLNLIEDELIILIDDDGIGFDNRVEQPGTGLKNIRELVNQLGGKVQVNSSPGNGTTISITIPQRS